MEDLPYVFAKEMIHSLSPLDFLPSACYQAIPVLYTAGKRQGQGDPRTEFENHSAKDDPKGQ